MKINMLTLWLIIDCYLSWTAVSFLKYTLIFYVTCIQFNNGYPKTKLPCPYLKCCAYFITRIKCLVIDDLFKNEYVKFNFKETKQYQRLAPMSSLCTNDTQVYSGKYVHTEMIQIGYSLLRCQNNERYFNRFCFTWNRNIRDIKQCYHFFSSF